jgi:hypothetical protein
MKPFAFAIAAAVTFALSAGTASAQYIHKVPTYGGYGGYKYGGYNYGYTLPGYNYGYSQSFYTPPAVVGGYRHPSFGYGHYDYIPGHYDYHRGHYDYHPGHYDYHAPGHRAPRH